MNPAWYILPLVYLAGIGLSPLWPQASLLQALLWLPLTLLVFWRRRYWWPLCLSAGLLMFAASGWTAYRAPQLQESDLAFWAPQRTMEMRGWVLSAPQKTGSQRWQWDLSVTDFRPNTATPFQISRGKVRLFLKQPQKPVLQPGEQIRVFGRLERPQPALNPGGFSYRDYLEQQGIFSLCYAQSFQRTGLEAQGLLWSFRRLLFALRQNLVGKLEAQLPADTAHLLGSLVLGEQASPVPDPIKEQFQAVGLQHVLAVSGFQVQLVVLVLLGLGQALRLPRWLNVLLALLALWFFVALTGGPASVLRAAAVTSLMLLAYLCFRQAQTLIVLLLGCCLLLLWNPHLLFDIGFQFSALATLGLISSSERLQTHLSWMPLPLSAVLTPILSAQVWVLPAQLYHFGTFSWLFLPANLIAECFITALTWLTLGGMLSAYLLPWIQGWVLWPAGFLTRLLLQSLGLLVHLPQPVWQLRPWSLSMTLGAYLCLLLPLAWPLLNNASLWAKFSLHRSKALHSLLLALLLSLPLLGCGRHLLEQHHCPLRITYLYVGQGDAIVIEAGSKTLLLDAGPRWETADGHSDAGERYILPYLRQRGIHQIDLAILSHAHLDHYGGYFSLLEALPIQRFVTVPGGGDSPDYQRLLQHLHSKGIPVKMAQNGSLQELLPQQMPGLRLSFWHPLAQELGLNSHELNNHSLVLKLHYGALDFLFPGDLERAGEAALLQERGFTVGANVILKVPHHGSQTSSTEAFLQAIHPREAIISVGQHNRFHHPSGSVLERYATLGIRTWRTDQQGGICLCADAETPTQSHYEVRAALSPTT